MKTLINLVVRYKERGLDTGGSLDLCEQMVGVGLIPQGTSQRILIVFLHSFRANCGAREEC